MELIQKDFGKTPDGRPAHLFLLSNSNQLKASITNYGGILTAFEMPDRNDIIQNICLGFDNLESYLKGHPYFGCIVGRYANRIGGGQFVLNENTYHLACNDNGVNHLHGGESGFDKKLWAFQPSSGKDYVQVELTYTSADGEEGYPGNVEAKVTYRLNNKNEFIIDYKAATDAPTPINLTNHAYWNLGGTGSGKIYDHLLKLNSGHYLPVDDKLIPTGEIKGVENTPLDFRKAKRIGQDLDKIGGYDHCFVINRSSEGLCQTAEVYDPASGRGLEILTTKPGVQLYTANFLDGIIGTQGIQYNKHEAFCLETQYYPDSVNKSQFPSVIFESDDIYQHTTVHRFFIKK